MEASIIIKSLDGLLGFLGLLLGVVFADFGIKEEPEYFKK